MRVLVVAKPLIDGIEDRLPSDVDSTTVAAEAVPDHLATADAVITDQWPAAWFEHATGVEWVQAVSAGVDHLPIERLQEHGITVTNASGVHPGPIAEYVYGALLASERSLFAAQKAEASREWRTMVPQEAAGRTLTVVGVGAIGRTVAERAEAFDLTVRGVDPTRDESLAPVDTWYRPDDLTAAVAEADYVVLTCPLNDATRGMVDQAVFDAMDTEAVLVNVARGSVVDQNALVAALETGSIRGAVLDVFEEEPLPEDSPLWNLENCLVTPHMAGYTPRYAERLADVFTENLNAFQAQEEMPTRVT